MDRLDERTLRRHPCHRLATSTTTQNHPNSSLSFQPPPKPASLSTVKLLHNDSPNDSDKPLAAYDFARSSWKETTGPDIPSTPSTGRYQEKPLTLWRTAPKFSSSNLHTTIFQLKDACTESNLRQITSANLHPSHRNRLAHSKLPQPRSLCRKELLRGALGETLTIHHTQLDLALILIEGIWGTLTNQHFQMNPNNREPIFRALVNSQKKIGWQHLLKGRFSNQ